MSLFVHDPNQDKFVITIDNDKFDELKGSLSSQGINSNAAGLTDECMKTFILAEYATQYPDDVVIRIEVTGEEKEEINKRGRGSLIKHEDGKDYLKATGCIKFYRPEFTNDKLKLTDIETLEKYEKEEDNVTFDDVKNKFALDKAGNIVIPQKEKEKEIEGDDERQDEMLDLTQEDDGFDWEEFNKKTPKREEETPLPSKKIPYKTSIAIYSMPYEFLTQLTTFTQCPEYGLKVADLAINKTKIKINILDDSKTTEKRVTEQYKSHSIINYIAGAKAKVLGNAWGLGTESENRTKEYYDRELDDFTNDEMLWDNRSNKIYTHDYEVPRVKRKNTITTQYTSQIQIEEGESWFVKKTTSYQIEEKDPELDDSVENNPDINNDIVDSHDRRNMVFTVPGNYEGLNDLNNKEERFRDFIKNIYNDDQKIGGTSINDFREKLIYDKDDFEEYVDKYVEDKEIELFKRNEYDFETFVGPITTAGQIKYNQMRNAIESYHDKDQDWKIYSNTYDVLPSHIVNRREDIQQKTAYYKSEKIYNVNNAGESEERWQDFANLLVKDVTKEEKELVYYNTEHGDKAPCKDLVSGAEMFFKIMAENKKTANLEDAMRYIMYKITGTDYGVKSFQKALFSMQNFGTGDILYDYIRIRENMDLYLFHIGETSSSIYASTNHYKTLGDPTAGLMDFTYGVVINPPNVDDVFEEFGVSPSQVRKYTRAGMEVTEFSHQQAERFFERVVDKVRQSVKSDLASAGIQLNEDELNAITIISYAFGSTGNFKEVYHLYKEGKIEQFKANFAVRGVNVFLETCHGWDEEDVNMIYRMFSEGYYECRGRVLNKMDYKKMGGLSGRGGTIVEKAIECHRYLRENGFTYNMDYGKSIPEFIDSPAKHVDCSTYVSWVLYMAGFDSFAGGQETEFRSNYSYHGLIKVPNDQVQPGDILCESGHVEIAAKVDNGVVTLVYNCGGKSSVESEGVEGYEEASYPGSHVLYAVLRAP